MKIVTKNAVYIEKEDIYFMIQYLDIIPFSIIQASKNNNCKSTNNFIKITEPDAIKFLIKQSWLPNYNALKDLSLDQITYIEYEYVSKETIILNAILNELEASNNKNELHNYISRRRKLDYYMISLKSIINVITGIEKLSLPEELEVTSNSNKITNLMRKIFRKK